MHWYLVIWNLGKWNSVKWNETRRIGAIFASFWIARVSQRQLGFLVNLMFIITLPVNESAVIPQYLLQSDLDPFLLYSGIIIYWCHSSGMTSYTNTKCVQRIRGFFTRMRYINLHLTLTLKMWCNVLRAPVPPWKMLCVDTTESCCLACLYLGIIIVCIRSHVWQFQCLPQIHT